jgi:hypothetical protein
MSYTKDWVDNIIRLMEEFTFSSGLDLNIGYYHIKLYVDTQKLCMIVLT